MSDAVTARRALEDLLETDAPAIRATLPPAFPDAMERYVELLLAANARVNLTRIVAPMNLQLSQPSNPAAAKARAQKDASVVDARFLIQTYVSKTSANLPLPPTTGDN